MVLAYIEDVKLLEGSANLDKRRLGFALLHIPTMKRNQLDRV